MTFWKNTVAAVTLVAATSAMTAGVVADKQAPPDMEAMMEAWMELSTPGPEHAEMLKMVGKWSHETKHWMEPGAPPEESTSRVSLEPIMGGRFLLEELRGTVSFGGHEMPFEGLGIFGYDRAKEKYVFTWIDSMGTAIMTGEGTADPTGKVITYFSEMQDPFTGGIAKIKSVSTTVNDDENYFEMFYQLPDGHWFKNMQIVGRRDR